MKITNFTCFKVTEKKNDKAPDYRLSAKVGDDWTEVGAGWVKVGTDGNKFISFKLKEPYDGKPGFIMMPAFDSTEPLPDRAAPAVSPEDDDL